MSQSSWQIGRPDLNTFFFFYVFFFFFFFFWAADVSDLSRSQLWNMELDLGWTRYKTEHRVEKVCCTKCFIVSDTSFLVYFDKQVHKKLEKKLSKQKKYKPWILLNQTRTEKQMRAAALRHRIYFFLALCNVLVIHSPVWVENSWLLFWVFVFECFCCL